MATIITSPDAPALGELCRLLAAQADAVDAAGEWPREQLAACGTAGVFQWFLPPEWGGQAWSDVDVVKGYLALSAACLTTTFIITQQTGACRRLAACENEPLKAQYLPPLARGETFATVGISHLTTSRRHLQRPVLQAARTANGYLLNGFSPWVTGGTQADWILTGGTVVEGGTVTREQILAVVPTNQPGVTASPPPELVGVSASQTGQVHLENVLVPHDHLVNGPCEQVMLAGRATRPGGHETSTLALGLAQAAIDYLKEEAAVREELQPAYDALRSEHTAVMADLLAIAGGDQACGKELLRQRANSLVLRVTQAALAAAKGAGYVSGHPAGRWCREALFFLVWSCPQPVMHANLCELAGLGSD